MTTEPRTLTPANAAGVLVVAAAKLACLLDGRPDRWAKQAHAEAHQLAGDLAELRHQLDRAENPEKPPNAKDARGGLVVFPGGNTGDTPPGRNLEAIWTSAVRRILIEACETFGIDHDGLRADLEIGETSALECCNIVGRRMAARGWRVP